MTDLSSNRHTVFLSPVEYANFMGTEHSLKSELEEVLEDPSQLCTTTVTNDEPTTSIKKFYRTRSKRDQSDTDGESTMNDSAFSDTESLSRCVNVYASMSFCSQCEKMICLEMLLLFPACLVLRLVLIAIDVHLYHPLSILSMHSTRVSNFK